MRGPIRLLVIVCAPFALLLFMVCLSLGLGWCWLVVAVRPTPARVDRIE